jgi:hypothetical protein
VRQQHERGATLPRDESDFAVAIHGDQRHLHRAQPRQCRAQHERLDPRRQHPHDACSGPDAERVQAGRGALGALAHLPERELPVVLVDDEHDRGRPRRPPLDQRPQIAIVEGRHRRAGLDQRNTLRA